MDRSRIGLARAWSFATAALLALVASVVAITVSTTAAQAAAACTGSVSVYGVLADRRMTYTAIDPDNGNLAGVQVSTATLPFLPVAMATLNFNTVLITSPGGVLYRVDIITNSNSLVFNPPVEIAGGWTHDHLASDGHGHLYGTVNGQLIQYVVSRDKPGAAQIGLRKVVGPSGFTVKTLSGAGDDWLIATNSIGELISYSVSAAGATTRHLLDTDGWQSFQSLLSPGGGLYYGRNPDGAMYWYEDDDPADGSGGDISYHLNDPVASRGWTQSILSAVPGTCVAHPTNPLRPKIVSIAKAEVGTTEASCDRYHPSCDAGAIAWCAMFATWVWQTAGISGLPRSQFFAGGLGAWGVDHGLYHSRSGTAQGSPKPGDWAIYGPPSASAGGHVDVVVAVRPDGTLVVVGGNVSNKVAQRTINPATARMGTDNVLISGYVTPPGA
jgi:hypothetical protein